MNLLPRFSSLVNSLKFLNDPEDFEGTLPVKHTGSEEPSPPRTTLRQGTSKFRIKVYHNSYFARKPSKTQEFKLVQKKSSIKFKIVSPKIRDFCL